MKMNVKTNALLAVLMLMAVVLLSGCVSEPDTVVPDATPTPVPTSEMSSTDIISEAADVYLSTTPTGNRVLSAESLKEKLDAGDQTIYVLDIRMPKEDKYDIGHIEGAQYINFKELAKEDSLATLPKGKQIIIVCDTGHTASMANSILNMLEYNALTLKFGMAGWTEAGYETVLDVPEAPATYDLPDDAEWEEIRAAADVYLSTTPTGSRVLSAESLKEKLDAGDQTIYVLDIRTPKEDKYDVGHIEGAEYISFKELAKEDNLATLPKGKQIIIVCDTGHTASMSNSILNMLEYNALTLKFGMQGWTEAEYETVVD